MADRETSKWTRTPAEEALDVKERRRSARFEAAFDIIVSKTNNATRRIATEAWVRDVSVNGLGICCAQAFEVGDAVTVRAPGKSLQCEVRHCRSEGALFSVGLEVVCSSDGTDIEVSLRDLSKALHFSDRIREDAPE
jgi:hypothetical protein